MGKVVTFGEIMLRLSPKSYNRLVQAEALELTYGGGEANVAVSIANYGGEALFVSKVPDNPLGQAAINHLRRFGIDPSYVLRGGERLGIYFLETGASQRPSKVIYDRKNSSLAQLETGEIPWEKVFQEATWFHFTGITPALGDNVVSSLKEALIVAKKAKVIVSCDLNFRKNLWTPSKAQVIMTELMEFVDILIGNEEDADKVFGIKADATDVDKGQIHSDSYQSVAAKLKEKFNCRIVAITLRESYSAFDNGWSALLYDGRTFYHSKKYSMHIVDRVGGGDAFAGGLIYALSNGYEPQGALEFAVAASCLKHTIFSDFNHVTKEEVLALMQGDSSGRVQR